MSQKIITCCKGCENEIKQRYGGIACKDYCDTYRLQKSRLHRIKRLERQEAEKFRMGEKHKYA